MGKLVEYYSGKLGLIVTVISLLTTVFVVLGWIYDSRHFRKDAKEFMEHGQEFMEKQTELNGKFYMWIDIQMSGYENNIDNNNANDNP